MTMSTRKKPVILVTVYRRYFELARTIERIHELKHEFSQVPDIVVIWAQPEVTRIWFFNRLLQEGKIQRLLTRPQLPDEFPSTATTYAESHNLRIGLNHIKATYDASTTYALCQAADVYANPEQCYQYIDRKIQEGEEAVVLFWPNGCIHDDIWHTNMFAVPLDESYWPPVASLNDSDVLERQWGLLLKQGQPPYVHKNHNHNNKRFLHEHLSEFQEEWPRFAVEGGFPSTLFVSGYVPWWKKLFGWMHSRRSIFVI